MGKESAQLKRSDIARLIDKLKTSEYPKVKAQVTIHDAVRATSDVVKVDPDDIEQALKGRE